MNSQPIFAEELFNNLLY